MKDLRTKINNVVKTGKVVFGSKSVVKSLLVGNPRLIVLSRNCPEKEGTQIAYYAKLASVPVETAEESSIDLGSVCSKPFPVSAISVLDAGESGILSSSEE